MLKWIAVVATSLAIVGCGGGGGGAGNSPFDPSPNPGDPVTPPAATIEVLASSNSVGTGGDDITITAIVKDAGNNSVAGTPISFSTDSGTLSNVSATTDEAGVATAKLSAGADKNNRNATITATAGSVSGNIVVPISGSKLTYAGVTTLALNSQTTLTVTAVDSKGNAVAGVPVNVTSSLGNGLSATSASTNAQGQSTFTYTATNSGEDTIAFSGLGNASTSTTMTVSGEDFTFTAPNADTQVVVGQAQVLSVRYRQNGVPQVGRTVNFAATVGTLSASSVVTDGTGTASVTVSSAFAGSSQVSATLTGGNTAQATLPIRFIATVPAAIVLQVSPTALGPNQGASTANQTTATAKVTDASGNPVTGVVVNFSQQQDLSGGALQQASAVTDQNGLASVKYVAGPNSTASGGVILKATVASNPAVSSTATLTVSQSALFIALGTGNTITNIDPQTYQKDWVVYVTDANGVAVSGVTITVKALPVSYLKGSLVWGGRAWGATAYTGPVDPGSILPDGTYISCDNEDANYNGVLDPNEDQNGSGKLEPGNVISVTPGTLVTGAGGRATMSLIYAESYAPWVGIELQVEAIVSGTASSTSAVFVVDGASSDFTNQNVPPAGLISPFGTRASCGSRF